MSLNNQAFVVKNSPNWYMWETLAKTENSSISKFLDKYGWDWLHKCPHYNWKQYEDFGFKVVQVKLEFLEIE